MWAWGPAPAVLSTNYIPPTAQGSPSPSLHGPGATCNPSLIARGSPAPLLLLHMAQGSPHPSPHFPGVNLPPPPMARGSPAPLPPWPRAHLHPSPMALGSPPSSPHGPGGHLTPPPMARGSPTPLPTTAHGDYNVTARGKQGPQGRRPGQSHRSGAVLV